MNAKEKRAKRKGTLKRLDSYFLQQQADDKISEQKDHDDFNYKLNSNPLALQGVGKALLKLRSMKSASLTGEGKKNSEISGAPRFESSKKSLNNIKILNQETDEKGFSEFSDVEEVDETEEYAKT